jgi:hypothetical protein
LPSCTKPIAALIQYHAEDHAGVDQMAEYGGDNASGQQDVDDDVVELQQQALPGSTPARLRKPVGAIAVEPRRRLGLAQAPAIAGEAFQDLRRARGMPGATIGDRRARVACLRVESTLGDRLLHLPSPRPIGTSDRTGRDRRGFRLTAPGA